MKSPAARGFFRLRLRTILLLINLVVLALPLGGIFVLRIYESALVRQTESELIAQGAVIAAAYQTAYVRHSGRDEDPDYGNPLQYQPPGPPPEGRYRPRSA